MYIRVNILPSYFFIHSKSWRQNALFKYKYWWWKFIRLCIRKKFSDILHTIFFDVTGLGSMNLEYSFSGGCMLWGKCTRFYSPYFLIIHTWWTRTLVHFTSVIFTMRIYIYIHYSTIHCDEGWGVRFFAWKIQKKWWRTVVSFFRFFCF